MKLAYQNSCLFFLFVFGQFTDFLYCQGSVLSWRKGGVKFQAAHRNSFQIQHFFTFRLDVYKRQPIAQRLGISKIKIELDDLSLKYLKPDVYYDLKQNIALRKTAREAFVQQIVDEVSSHISEAGIKAEVSGRVKHFFSIYKKMVNQDKTLDQIYDLFAIRIIVDTVKDCYAALGVIHETVSYTHLDVYKRQSMKRAKRPPCAIRRYSAGTTFSWKSRITAYRIRRRSTLRSSGCPKSWALIW